MKPGFTLVELLVVIAIIAILAGVGVPTLISRIRDGHRTEATMKARQVGLALFSFDGEWGSYPDDGTAEDIKEDLKTDLTLGNASSNDYFRQLIATGHMDQEASFFARTSYIKSPGDNNMVGAEALKAGEVGYAYIMKQGGKGISRSDNSATPVIVSPIREGDTSGVFEEKTYNRKAVVLQVDSSVKEVTIRSIDGKAVIGGGRTLLDTGEGTVWGDDVPEIKPPLSE